MFAEIFLEASVCIGAYPKVCRAEGARIAQIIAPGMAAICRAVKYK